MSEESNSILSTIQYYKSKIKFPTFSKQYNEMNETQEQKELFFCNSKQRKEESYRQLKEWAQNRREVLDKNKALIEELVNICDYRIRLSGQYLQIVYKFFNEKYFHEQQYGQFLLTKPQPTLKQNPLSHQLYSNIGQAISTFEETNLKNCEKVSNFAHTISNQILKTEILSDLFDLDKKSDQILSCIIAQKKLLQQQYILSAQKLKAITDQFPQQLQNQRARKPIFDNPIQNEQQNQHIEQKQNQTIEDQNIEPSTIKVNDISEVLADDQLQVNNLSEQLKENQIDGTQSCVYQQENTDNSSNNSVQKQIDPQLLKDKHYFEMNNEGQKVYQSQTVPFSLPINRNFEQKQKQHQEVDLYKLIMSYTASQSYTIKLLNQLIEKVIQYWKHVTVIEQKRTKWAQESCQIYKEAIKDVHYMNVELPQFKMEVEDYYSFRNIFSDSCSSFENVKDQNEFCQSLIIKELGCQAARLLLVKEFKVNVVEKNSELPSILVLTIDKFVGCWLKYDDSTDAIDSPVLHYPISQISIQNIGNLLLEIIPSKNLLFLNISNGRQKSTIKFACIDDMEEFSTIIKN
ncbi:unnamed protein product [Paramecium sonneborni]|uniref:Uncharacterized protein n=1 Tax=Paramecium sonneborni TaxID=65129 RepID=A0A8S1QXJ4_9CILI|nr:unnamed protein product [Paramecium sonneborni]